VTDNATGSDVTVTVTVALSVPPCPSLIVYEKISVPLKPAAGVYVIVLSELTPGFRAIRR
jgi:hypothetical protein